MSDLFMHIGKFVIRSESRDAFVEIMKTYEKSADQSGLNHSHLIEDENVDGTFMHVTLWNTRDDWVAVEQTSAHKEMHKKRDALLAKPMEHDFVCGKVRM